MFSIIEAITQHPPLLVESQVIFVDEVLPILATFIKSDDGNIKMLCLKLFSDISTFFLEFEGDELTTARNQKSPKAALLKVCIVKLKSISFLYFIVGITTRNVKRVKRY